MKKKLLPLFILTLFTLINKAHSQFHFPPEWAPQEAVWTDFASEITFPPNQNAKAEIISTLSRYVKTKVVYDSESLKEIAIGLLKEKNSVMDSIEFVKTSAPMNWIRDPGPLFVTNGKEVKVIDFKWSCYGDVYNCNYDKRGQINDEITDGLGLVTDSYELYLEGGGIEVSNNTIIAYKAMAAQRNPDRSLKEVEETLLKAYGKEQVIWLDEFPLIDKPNLRTDNYFGQGANGHIDVTTRFLNDSTILTTVISEVDKNKSSILTKDHEILQSSLEQLKSARQPNGKPYIIETVAAPDYTPFEEKMVVPVFMWNSFPQEVKDKIKVGDEVILLPALEYANFTITNGAILVSEYWKEGMPDSLKESDKAIKDILRKYFPSREIIGLDVLPINWGGGSIHCRTQQQPRVK